MSLSPGFLENDVNGRLIDWCLMPTLAIFQLYRGVMTEDDNLQQSKSNNGYLQYFFLETKSGCNETKQNILFVCTKVLYKYMKSLRNDVHNLSGNRHVQVLLIIL